jgi:hypothetical protein
MRPGIFSVFYECIVLLFNLLQILIFLLTYLRVYVVHVASCVEISLLFAIGYCGCSCSMILLGLTDV